MEFEVSNQPARRTDLLKGRRTGKWTKYGGAVHGLVKERIKGEWSCQMCAETMPMELKPFLFELYDRDYIRICNGCQHLVGKKKEATSILTFRRIIKIVRNHRD